MARKQSQIMWVIFVSLLSSLGIYAALTFAVPGGSVETGDGDASVTIIYALIAMAVVSFGMSFLLPKLLMPKVPFLTKKILSWALAESIALYGIVIHFISGNRASALGLIGWSALTMILHGPYSIPDDK